MRFRIFGIGVATAAIIAMGAAPAMATSLGDGQLGGPPSPSFVADQTLCPEGQAVTGVVGATRVIGGFINIVAVATVQCSGGSPGSTMGSGPGLPGATNCPAGQVAVGIVGREGDFIDLLNLLCQNADGEGLLTPSVGVLGGGLGTPDGPYVCPEDTVLTGLRGQSVPPSALNSLGSTIRYVEITCAEAEKADKGDKGDKADKADKGDKGDNSSQAD